MNVCTLFVLVITALIQIWLSKAYEQQYIKNGKYFMEEGELKYISPNFVLNGVKLSELHKHINNEMRCCMSSSILTTESNLWRKVDTFAPIILVLKGVISFELHQHK